MTQTIQIEAALPGGPLPGLVAILHRPSGDEEMIPRDDGMVPGDTGGDGIYTASFTGNVARFVDLEILLRRQSEEVTLFRRVVVLQDSAHSRISLYMEQRDGEVMTSRVAWLPYEGRSAHLPCGNQVSLTVAFGWGILCFLYAAMLVWLGIRRSVARR